MPHILPTHGESTFLHSRVITNFSQVMYYGSLIRPCGALAGLLVGFSSGLQDGR
jgi:hypothetical protein